MPEWVKLTLYLLIVFVLCTLIGLQGIDLTDEGWMLTGFQQFFERESNVESMFTLYGTLMLGGLWYKVLGYLGIIGFRILTALTITFISYVVYLLLREVVKIWILLIGMIFVVVNLTFIQVFHYNYISSLFVCLIALMLYEACVKESLLHMFVAGFLVGFSVLFRLPNISYVALIFILVPYYVTTLNLKVTCMFFGIAVTGFLTGIGCDILLICIFGHQYEYLHMLQSMYNDLTTIDSSHNHSRMIVLYRMQTIQVVKYMLLLLTYSTSIGFLLQSDKQKAIRFIIVLCLTILFGYTLYHQTFDNGKHIILYGTILYVLLGDLVFRTNSTREIYLSILAILILLLLPIGSDGGIFNVGMHALYVAVPLLLWKVFVVYQQRKIAGVARDVIVNFVMPVFLIVFATDLNKLLAGNFRDKDKRINMVYRPRLTAESTTYTTYERAMEIDSICYHIQELTQGNPYVLTYPQIPGLHYLTRTKPYLDEPWTGLMNYQNFAYSLILAQEKKQLPIIVFSKASYLWWYEPSESWTSVNSCYDNRDSAPRKKKLLSEFIQKYNYSIAYDDLYFQVLTSQK